MLLEAVLLFLLLAVWLLVVVQCQLGLLAAERIQWVEH